MLMTKITSSTRSESILDIDKFPTHYFKNRKYVFPNNKLVASFSLSVVYKCLSYKANACFFKLVNESTSLKPDCIWKAKIQGLFHYYFSYCKETEALRYCVCFYCYDTPWTSGSFSAVGRRPVPGYSPATCWEAVCYLRFCQAQVGMGPSRVSADPW